MDFSAIVSTEIVTAWEHSGGCHPNSS